MSYVNSQSRHERLNFESIMAFRRVAHWLNDSTPIILETPVEADEVDEEISAAERVFNVTDYVVHSQRRVVEAQCRHDLTFATDADST